ncbi:MAG: hypothetical protein APF83_10950 [Lutibacter sp. BRH_c52]|nr:MAG: hypothetical protein APF83_10950 [Lutibacter sp. BRH_c52]
MTIIIQTVNTYRKKYLIMKKGSLIAISIFFAFQIQLKAQEKIVVLHTLVGATIDKTEMDTYKLFSEYRNDSIEYFILSTHKEITYLIGVQGQQIIFTKEIGNDYISMQRENIERMNNDHSSFSKTDSTLFTINKTEYINNKILKVDPIIMTPEIRKSIKKSIIQENALKNSKKYETNKKQGFKQ